jgi:ABC-2 type transport system ATP-binding protein
MNANPVVEFEGVAKNYPTGLLGRGALRAVAGVTFRVHAGEVFGLLGPNRAGKTTLIKVLLSLCRPSKGAARRFGVSVADRRTLARVGYVHENQAFPRYLHALALLEYYGALSLLPEPEVRRRAGELIERVGLADRAHEPIARFSKGMVQRLGLAQALINDPELLVLDEPGEGLDLDGRQLVRDMVAEQRRQGRTVILVSHHIAEIETICDRVGVLVSGRLAYVGTVAKLTQGTAGGPPRPLEKVLQEMYAKKATEDNEQRTENGE